MKIAIAITALIALTGCWPSHKDMPPEEVLARVKACHALGMDYRILTYVYDESIGRVQCLPKT